ncbi:tRNA pseudouridine synthase B [Mycoplasma sp. CAG:956]|nr:tRNA pseudouridine synthase B [Mycoplasma sp. CAG:956]
MIINVCKEKNMTSRDVVNIISKHLHTKKVGHTGTLDPLATGVLIVCTNHDTKLVDILTSKNKEYIATMRLGIQTDTGDITGNIIKRATYKVTKDQIIKVLNNFLGSSTQTVPIYSAVKINGKKLYEYARNGEEVTLPTREINISNIELLDYHDDLIKFKVTVSKGTYIRSLIEDIGKTLQTVATMEDLVRTKQGNYKIEDSYTLEDIKNDNYKPIPLNIVLKDYHTYNLNATEYFKVKNGSKMLLNIDDKIVTLLYNNKPIALYRKENDIYRVYKMLEINTDDN